MRAKLERRNLPITADSALQDVWDAAGVRLVCPFVQNIDQTVSLIRQIPGVQILREKDYIRNPKPNGYRSYHMIGGRNFNFLRGQMVGISKFREKTTVFCPFARWPSQVVFRNFAEISAGVSFPLPLQPPQYWRVKAGIFTNFRKSIMPGEKNKFACEPSLRHSNSSKRCVLWITAVCSSSWRWSKTW